MNSGSFSRKSSTVRNLGGFSATASHAQISHTLYEIRGCLVGFSLSQISFWSATCCQHQNVFNIIPETRKSPYSLQNIFIFIYLFGCTGS